MKIGYVRVSTAVQVDGYSLEQQKEKLREAGCEKIFEDVMSGAKKERPGMSSLLEAVREGDTVVVVKLDRFGRSLANLLELMTDFDKRGVVFVSLSESIDTSTAIGRMMFNILGSIAEFERELIMERTQAGIAQARAAGVKFGRPSKFNDVLVKKAVKLYRNDEISSVEAARVLGVSRASYYRLLDRAKDMGLFGDDAPAG